MNWHSIGRFLKKIIKNAIIIDFGSTTTDFIVIKNGEILNKNFDDFSHRNHELLYTGFTRTPIFGICQQLKIQGKLLSIIPEFFSDTADIYKVIGQLDTKIDIDITADGFDRSYSGSLEEFKDVLVLIIIIIINC